MVAKHRTIILITVLGVAFVGIAAALKTAQLMPTDQAAAADEAVDQSSALTVDQDFFATSTNTVPSNPPSPSASVAVKTYAPDEVAADAYLVGDVSTGKIYLQKNITEVLPFASMSKLITAIIATRTYQPDQVITVTEQDTKVPSDTTGISAGEGFTVNELLYPLLLASSNVSAEALASEVNRAKFLESMSGFAWEIGMADSYFGDPTGLSDHNRGTAKGFFALAQYLYSDRRDLLAITRTPHEFMATTTTHGSHDIASIHPFVNDPRFLGGKTGHTDYALDTMLTILDIGGHPIALIVLHSPDRREQDTNILADKVSAMIAAGF